MSHKQSTQSVDNRPFWRQKIDFFRDGVVPSDPLVRRFDPPRDPRPMTVTLRLPTMAERVAEFTRLGRVAQSFRDFDDDDDSDDFEDHLDGLPPEGLSPHEDRSYVHVDYMPVKASKKLADKPKASSATPVAGGSESASQSATSDQPAPVEDGD